MEKLNFIKINGAIKLPPGFRFHPTDEELVVQYLKRKAFSCPLPASIIPEVNVCKYDPWDLPGDSEKEKYFFSTREAKYLNGNRSNRATSSGYWKASGLDKKIVDSTTNQLVGMKKTMVFYTGKPPKGCKTDWIMHEYRLVIQNSMPPQLEDCVLCRIFLKKRNSRNETPQCSQNRVKAPYFEFIKLDNSSSSASSGVTDVSCVGSDEEEGNSSCNSVSFSSSSSCCSREPRIFFS